MGAPHRISQIRPTRMALPQTNVIFALLAPLAMCPLGPTWPWATVALYRRDSSLSLTVDIRLRAATSTCKTESLRSGMLSILMDTLTTHSNQHDHLSHQSLIR